MKTKLFTYALVACSFLALPTVVPGCAAETADADPTDDEVRSGTAGIHTFVGADGQFYFHLKGGNGEKLLASEGYVNEAGRNNGIASVKLNGSKTANYEVREASSGQFYLVLKAPSNGQIIGVTETYSSKSNATRARDRIARLFTNIKISEAPRVARFETFKSAFDSQYYFHLRAGNGEILLQSEGYTTLENCKKGTLSVIENSGSRNYVVKTAADGRPYFIVVADNGETIAVSETYSSTTAVNNAVDLVHNTIRQQLAPIAAAQ